MNDVRILVADAEAEVRTLVKTHTAFEGYACDEAADGIAAIKLFRRNEYKAIIIDSHLSELDAFNVCRQIRKNSDLPILIVSRQCSEEDRLLLFDIGVDDIISKPFSYKELVARIRVLLRHHTPKNEFTQRRIVFGGLCIDLFSRVVYIDGETVDLTPKEYSLLLFLAQNPNKAMSRDTILNQVWGEDFFGTDRTVDTHIKTLRENIKPYHEYVATVWGFGYIFRV
jgi:two-component system response regulator ResD